MKFEIEIKPTEDLEKLKLIVSSLFPDATPKITKDKITGETDGTAFWGMVDRLEIRSTIENEFENGYISLSKAAALKGNVSVDIGSSIGSIKLFK